MSINLSNLSVGMSKEAQREMLNNRFIDAYNQGMQQSIAHFQGIVTVIFLACISYTILTAYMNRNPDFADNRWVQLAERTNFMIIFAGSAFLFVSLFINPLW